MFFSIPDSIISQPAPVVSAITTRYWRCVCTSPLLHPPALRNLAVAPPRVRVSLEVGVAPATVGHVQVDLRGREVGVAEHLLDAAEVGAALEQVRREGVPQQVRVDPLRLEAGLAGQPAQDQERARACQRPALRVEEELRPVAAIEVRPAAGEVAPQRLGRGAADRDDAILAALAGAANEPLVEVDPRAFEPDRFAD